MAHHKAVLSALVALLIFLLAAPVSAQGDPTATPTATPYPIPTGAFEGLRITPTPFTRPTLAPPDGSFAADLADWTIQAWWFINLGKTEDNAGIVDWIIFIALLALAIRGMSKMLNGRDRAYQDETSRQPKQRWRRRRRR